MSTKADYFIRAINQDAWRYRSWVFFVFSVVYADTPPDLPDDCPFKIYKDDKGYYEIVDGNIERIEGSNPNSPLVEFKEQIELLPGSIQNVKSKIVTTYGNVLFNAIAITSAFGNKVDFITGKINPKTVKKLILPRVVDDVPPEKEDPSKIYIHELRVHCTNIGHLSGFGQLCVPSATPRTLTRHPDTAKVLADLLEKYKDRLHDPATVALIDQEMVKLDRSWIDGDPDKGFYYKDKSFDVTRKKMQSFYGAEHSFSGDGTIELIRTSLREGWEIDKLPAMINTLRDGSYSRGADTALGGVAVQYFQRVFQNAKISQHDCGSVLGLPLIVDQYNVGWLPDRWMIVNGKTVEITPDIAKSLMGKEIVIRSPGFCKTEATDFCEVCMGKSISTTPNALSAHAGAVGSRFMAISMKAMHGKALKLAQLNINEMFS